LINLFLHQNFTDDSKLLQKPHLNNLKTLDINNALSKKAAGNIDINAMGDKGIFKYNLLIV